MSTSTRWLRALGLAILLLFPALALAWGDEAHRAAVRGATAALPVEMRPFFTMNREFIAKHSLDPDYIPNRTTAQKGEHFLDIDEYGKPPFKALPHDRADAERKFGAETVAKNGTLPWTIQREYDRLVAAFKAADWPEARLAAAHLAHFAADVHMPLHSTKNYDGQFTGNTGIHLRIEIELMPRYHGGSVVAPAKAMKPGHVTEWAFREVVRSWDLVQPLLDADTQARKHAPLDSDAYYAELNRLAGSLLSTRLREAAAALAGLYQQAWEQAGRPALPPERVVCIVVDTGKAQEAAPEKLAQLAATANRPFDVLAVLQVEAPKFTREIPVRFAAAGDAQENARTAVTPVGYVDHAALQAQYALAQFASSKRTLIILTDGWPKQARMKEAAESLRKAGGMDILMVTFGGEDVEAQGREFAAAAGGKAVHCASIEAAISALADQLKR